MHKCTVAPMTAVLPGNENGGRVITGNCLEIAITMIITSIDTPPRRRAATEIFREGKEEALGDIPPHVGGTAGGLHLPSIANGRRTPCGHRRPPEEIMSRFFLQRR